MVNLNSQKSKILTGGSLESTLLVSSSSNTNDLTFIYGAYKITQFLNRKVNASLHSIQHNYISFTSVQVEISQPRPHGLLRDDFQNKTEKPLGLEFQCSVLEISLAGVKKFETIVPVLLCDWLTLSRWPRQQ